MSDIETCEVCGAEAPAGTLWWLDCKDGMEILLCSSCRENQTVLEDHEVVASDWPEELKS